MLLTWLIVLPLVGALVAALSPRASWSRWISLAFALGAAGLAVSVWTAFDPSDGGFQSAFDAAAIPALGIRFHLGVDGISLYLVLLTALLTPLVTLASFRSAGKNPRGFFSLLLALEGALFGTFLSLDLVLFYIFWEVTLIPAFFLIGFWGGKGGAKAAVKFLLFTLVGSLPMLAAVLWIGHVGGTYDLPRLMDNRLPPDVQCWCFVICALAFLIKMPAVPFHAWMADAYAEAPAGVSALLAGVLSKMGAYGLLRICVPLFPDASQDFAPLLMALGVVGIVHGGLAAAAQTDLKRMMAYSSLSHMGFVLLAVFALNMQALQGALLQMVSHGVIIAALFLLLGMARERSGTDRLDGYGGWAVRTPFFATAFLFAALASAALPGLSGFVGEYLILSGVWKAQPVLVAFAVLGVILSAWYLLTAFNRVFLGPIRGSAGGAKDLSLREAAALLPLLALMLFLGVKPAPLLTPTEKGIQMNVLARLAPPPQVMDFAVQVQREREKEAAQKKADPKAVGTPRKGTRP